MLNMTINLLLRLLTHIIITILIKHKLLLLLLLYIANTIVKIVIIRSSSLCLRHYIRVQPIWKWIVWNRLWMLYIPSMWILRVVV